MNIKIDGRWECRQDDVRAAVADPAAPTGLPRGSTRGWRKLPLAGLLAAAALFQNTAHAALSDFVEFNYDDPGAAGIELPGRLFVPDDLDPDAAYPLVLFFHGAGEKGTDNEKQVTHNIEQLLANAKSRKFFLYAPQTNTSWSVSVVGDAVSKIEEAISLYDIDPSRVYVIGLSLGGGGVWTALSQFPEVFAAGVPICGVRGAMKPENLVGTPIWAFHARNDTTVSVEVTRRIVNETRTADGKTALHFPLNDDPGEDHYNTGEPYYRDGSTFYEDNGLRYGEFATGGHAIWTRVYRDNELVPRALFDWLLSQGSDASSSIYAQSFNGSNVIADYVAASPGAGQMHDISAEPGAGTWTIDGERLHLSKPAGTGAAGFARKAMDDAPSAAVKFDLIVEGFDAGWGPLGGFEFGDIVKTTSYAGASSHATIANSLDLKAKGDQRFVFIVNGRESPLYATGEALSIEYYLNYSEEALTYEAPDGAAYTLPAQTSDVWINGTRVFTNAGRPASFAASTAGGFRFRTTSALGLRSSVDDLSLEQL